MSIMNKKVTILIVEDHPIVREGMTQLIEKDPRMRVCAAAESVDEGLSCLEKNEIDLAIVDLSLKGRSGLEFIKTAKIANPGLLILVVSFFDEEVYAERCLRAGAKGYIMKSEATEKLVEAIQRILKGDFYVSPSIQQVFYQNLFQPGNNSENLVDTLSDRELEVFELIGSGNNTRQIAEILQLSIKTIETYKSHIKRKYGIQNVTKLVQIASEYNYSNAFKGNKNKA